MISDKDMIELSTVHAYKSYEVGEVIKVNGTSYILKAVFNEQNGMKHGTDAFVVENSSGEAALIYTGSDRRNDLYKDWVVANGSILLKRNVDQYNEGEKLYLKLKNEYDINAIGGVSLGGGVVTHIGINNSEVRVISINPAPQVNEVSRPTKNITTIIDTNDILYNTAKFFGRRNNYTDTLTFFSRGNNFFDCIKLNHVGYSNGLFLDESIPVDLLTNNLESTYIDLNSSQVKVINSNLNTYFSNLETEVNSNITPALNSAVESYKDQVKFEEILIKIITNLKTYFENKLPTLHQYIDFSYLFDELIEIVSSCSFSLLDSIVNMIVEELNLNAINKQLYSDSKNAQINFKMLNAHISNVYNTCNTVVENIENRDLSINAFTIPTINNYRLIKKVGTRNINYLVLYDEAKMICYKLLSNCINTYFKAVDTKLDIITYFFKTQFNVLGEVVSMISQEVARKLAIIEQILLELYNFDIGDAVYNVFVVCIEEIIGIVLNKDCENTFKALKYFSAVLSNGNRVHHNYNMHLNNYKSVGINSVRNVTFRFGKELDKYNNSLRNTYL